MPRDWKIQAIQDFAETFLLNSFQCQKEASSEYVLLKALDDAGLFDHLKTEDASLLLFQKHFLCMHALHKLQNIFYERNFYLHINALAIYLEGIDTSSSEESARPNHPGSFDNELHNYYLDLQQLDQTTSDSVLELQLNFSKRYAAWLNADDAFATLELDSQASWNEVRSSYKRLIHAAHPDKGGNAARFNKIKLAYEQLKYRFN